MKLLFATAALAAFALPAAAVTVGSTPIASPVASTGLETVPNFLPDTDYVDGGVVVRVTDTDSEGAQKNVAFQLADPHGVGSLGTIDPSGYFSARLEDGSSFNAFSGFFGSEGFASSAHLLVRFRFGGSTVGEVDAGTLANLGQTFSFTGFTADEVWFQGSNTTSFSVTGKDRIGFDDLAFGKTDAVPEPATWALMILGFGSVGALLRWRAYGHRLGRA